MGGIKQKNKTKKKQKQKNVFMPRTQNCGQFYLYIQSINVKT